jgi:hypothetical protein
MRPFITLSTDFSPLSLHFQKYMNIKRPHTILGSKFQYCAKLYLQQNFQNKMMMGVGILQRNVQPRRLKYSDLSKVIQIISSLNGNTVSNLVQRFTTYTSLYVTRTHLSTSHVLFALKEIRLIDS